MMRLHIGDTIPGLYPSTFTFHDIEEDKRVRSAKKRKPWERKPVETRVEYIHPVGRFAVVRFTCERGSFCEAFNLRRAMHGE